MDFYTSAKTLLIYVNIIKSVLLEWNANPVLISVETTDFPIENITFPSVTICREDNDQNCFEFVSKIFDFAEFPCFDEGQVYSRLVNFMSGNVKTIH